MEKLIGTGTIKKLVLFLGFSGLVFVAGRYTAPTKTETVEVIKWQTKTVTVAAKQTKKRTEKRTEVLPNGTKTVVEVSTDDSTTKASSGSETVAAVEKTTVTETVRPSWHLSVMGTVNHRRLLFFGQNVSGLYDAGIIGVGVHVQRRILGPVYLGGYANTNGELGLSLGASF